MSIIKRKCFKCGTEIEKEMIYCPECGVNLGEYFKENQTTLLLGKHPKDSVMAQERPKIGTGTIIFLIILTILIVPVGLIAALFVWYGHKKRVEEWQRNQIIKGLES